IKGSTVSVLLGNGDGAFQNRVDFPTGTSPGTVVAGDFNRDGRQDLAVGNQGSGTLSILVQNPVGTFSPTSVNFGNQKVGPASQAKTVTLTNKGSAPLSPKKVAITGKNSGDFTQTNNCGSTVVSGASCTFSVTFTPAALGLRSAALTLTDNAAGSPQK